jgi:hypothetical protein
MMINISLDLLIGLGSKLISSLWRVLCGYLLIKNSFVSSNGLLKLKIWIGHLIRRSQNEFFNIDSHSKFVIGTQYMM